MPLVVNSLASGSSGNSILVKDDNTSLLIDAGIGIRKIVASLEAARVNPADLSAILITHEHSDHIAGAVRMARRYNVPLVATAETLAHMDGAGDVPHKVIGVGDELSIGDLHVHSFEISHDAACPVGYSVSSNSATICNATDTGVLTPEICAHAAQADLLIIESNHDVNMLQTGPYPYYLKQRIAGDKGHISNDAAAGLLIDLVESGRQTSVWLAHLSKTNNSPAMALVTAQYLLWTCLGITMDINVAQRDIPSLIWRRDAHQLKFSYSGII